MHMHVTGFSAATILVFATASPLHAQGIEVFAGYSVNADYVQNRPAIPVVDQKVSPFFSHGSGPTGFEASFKHDVGTVLASKSMSLCNTQIPSLEECCCSPVKGSPRIEASITLTPMPMSDWRWRLAAALTSD